MDKYKMEKWYKNLDKMYLDLGALYDEISNKNNKLTDECINEYYKRIKGMQMELAKTALCYIQELDFVQYHSALYGEKITVLLKKLVNTECLSDAWEDNLLDISSSVARILMFIVILRWFIYHFLRTFYYSDSTRELINTLEEHADALIPDYGDMFVEVAELALAAMIPDYSELRRMENTLIDAAFRMFTPDVAEYDMGSDLLAFLEMSAFSYGEMDMMTARRFNISSLPSEQIPRLIRSSESYANGVLRLFGSLRVRFLQWNNSIVLSFAGTELSQSRWASAATDLLQLTGYSIVYQHAAGLLRMILLESPNSTVYVTGHSLGGGLAQFAAAANAGESNRLRAVIFNPAGLSTTSIDNLRTDRMQRISSHVWCVCAEYDYVSIIGMQLGRVISLPMDRWGTSAHFLDELRRLLELIYPRNLELNEQ